jgi:hypothetical protein
MFSSTRRVAGTLLTTAALTGAALAPGSAGAAPAPPKGASMSPAAASVAGSLVSKINYRPVFNNYLTCVPYNGKATVYADFVDPFGTDSALVVRISSAYNAAGPMGVSTGYHGTFWWKEMNLPYAHTILTFYATDPGGLTSKTWQAWLYADGHCGTPWEA